MHPVLTRTFGGLARAYYFRQFAFGLIFPAIIVYAFTHAPQPEPMSPSLIFIMVVNTFLYPYSRFVYERVVSFVMGDNVFIVNAFVMLFVKLVTMAMCWSMALVVAPIGLAYLYYRHKTASA